MYHKFHIVVTLSRLLLVFTEPDFGYHESYSAVTTHESFSVVTISRVLFSCHYVTSPVQLSQYPESDSILQYHVSYLVVQSTCSIQLLLVLFSCDQSYLVVTSSYLVVTSSYLVVTCSYLVITCSYLVVTTSYLVASSRIQLILVAFS